MMFWNGGNGHGMGAWSWIGMTAGTVLTVALVVGLLVLLVRTLNRPSDGPRAQQPSPERVLAERFARGEIDEDEYRRRVAALADTGAAPRGR